MIEVGGAWYRDSELETEVEKLKLQIDETKRMLADKTISLMRILGAFKRGTPLGHKWCDCAKCDDLYRACQVVDPYEAEKIGEKPRTPGFCACGWYLGHAGECTKPTTTEKQNCSEYEALEVKEVLICQRDEAYAEVDKLKLYVEEYRRSCEEIVKSADADLTYWEWKRRAQFSLDAMTKRNRVCGFWVAGVSCSEQEPCPKHGTMSTNRI